LDKFYAKRLGKTRIIAETGLDSTVCKATVCALMGLQLSSMGEVDIKRQAPNVL
jgi:tryptophan synthase beta subunit